MALEQSMPIKMPFPATVVTGSRRRRKLLAEMSTESSIGDADFNNIRKVVPRIVWVELMRTRTIDICSTCSISGIQQSTGARIHIDRSKCEVRLFGSDDAVASASSMIDAIAGYCRTEVFLMECSKVFSAQLLQDVADDYGVVMSRNGSEISIMGVVDAVGKAINHLEAVAKHRSHPSETSLGDLPTLVFPASPGARTVKALPQEVPAIPESRKNRFEKVHAIPKSRNEKFCMHCGQSMMLTARFCTECGERVLLMPEGAEESNTKANVVHMPAINSATNCAPSTNFVMMPHNGVQQVGFVSAVPVYFMPGMTQQSCMFSCTPEVQQGDFAGLGYNSFQQGHGYWASGAWATQKASDAAGLDERSTCCGSSNPTLDSLPPM